MTLKFSVCEKQHQVEKVEQRVLSDHGKQLMVAKGRATCLGALAFLQGMVSGSCVTSAAVCGVRRVLSRRRNSTQLGDQPKNGRGTSLSITAPTA